MAEIERTVEMQDLCGVDEVEIKVRRDGHVVWVNVDGVCRMRICRIAERVILEDDRGK